MNKVRDFAIGITGLVIVTVIYCLIVWGSLKLYDHINWKCVYQYKVEQTVEDMVKKECLNE